MLRNQSKSVSITGICQNCDNRLVCDFKKDITWFIRDRKSAEKIIGVEVSISSCAEYEPIRETINLDGVCSHCAEGN